MRRLLVLGLIALALPPATALAVSSAYDAATSASKGCAALRASIGESPFAQAFSSFGACVTSLKPVELSNSSAASASCRTERADVSFTAAHGGKTFAAFYRSGRAHAFGICVARKARASAAAEQTSAVNTSPCAGLEASTGASAFDACVSAAALARIAAQVSAASACAREQADTGFAGAHGGKTFDLYYGTGATLANAYGRCVAQKTQVVPPAAQPHTQPEPVPPVDGGGVPDRCGGAQGGGLDRAPTLVPRPESVDCPIA
jgi:hypothetical protein